MAKNANGAGTIRKKTVTRNGKTYQYWECRVTVGHDPGTGRQIQKSFTGKTQREARKKARSAMIAVENGTYIPPSKITLGEWLDIWVTDYMTGRKATTVDTYKRAIRLYVRPALGAVKLTRLHPHTIQKFINSLSHLAPGTVRQSFTVLHSALDKAVMLGYIPSNPAAGCELPKIARKEITPLDDEQINTLLEAARGSNIEFLVAVALFTGMRESELCGLTWDCVDFRGKTINICKQLATSEHRDSGMFETPKNGKGRTIVVAPTVVRALQLQQGKQMGQQLRAGECWSNPHGLVFTADDGEPYGQQRLVREFKKITQGAGLKGVRFHDLRHTYAVNAIRAGDDIKSIQGNLGHASAAFTMDRYGHFTERMKQDSADRMERFISGVVSG